MKQSDSRRHVRYEDIDLYGLVFTIDPENQIVILTFASLLTYCTRTLTRYSRINYMDQCITK